MRKNFSPAVWHRQENVFATSCSFLFSSLPVFLVFSWVTKIETKVERREEEEEEEKNVCLVGLCGCWLEITATYASPSSFYIAPWQFSSSRIFTEQLGQKGRRRDPEELLHTGGTNVS
jgi:hypothetical protein